MWITDHPVDDAGDVWLRLREAIAGRGLVAVVIDPYEDYWWQHGQFSELGAPVESWELSAGAVLERWWDAPEEEDVEDEFGDDVPSAFPGLAPATTERVSIDVLEAQVRELRDRRVALVPAERHGDVPSRIGWGGAVNPGFSAQGLTTVLWSWEVRFGALLVQIGDQTMDVFVSRPVVQPDHAWRVACEHFAFCPDIVTQGIGSIDGHALDVLGSTRWSFWWD